MASPPFSRSADANKVPILERLIGLLDAGGHVLEVASGTGQHALHFAGALNETIWQTSDRDLAEYELVRTLAAAALPNLPAPIELDVTDWPSGLGPFDAVYSANALHVMPPENLAPYIRGTASCLKAGGQMILYGPFKYGGVFTTPSNEQFDTFLRNTYPGGGIREFEEVDRLAGENGLFHQHDFAMPANNQLLVWRKGGA